MSVHRIKRLEEYGKKPDPWWSRAFTWVFWLVIGAGALYWLVTFLGWIHV